MSRLNRISVAAAIAAAAVSTSAATSLAALRFTDDFTAMPTGIWSAKGRGWSVIRAEPRRIRSKWWMAGYR